ncbi:MULTISPECIES: CopG family transcriptional regulator [unclassified Microcoleus]|uniref:CopG family transcriptional regulator n=1 Tax=unclassified Microcoleus TaxID=2642155 RepID=UPI002FD241DB
MDHFFCGGLQDPNFVRTTVYLPKLLHRQLKSAAAQSGQEMSELVEKSVAQYLQQFNPDDSL